MEDRSVHGSAFDLASSRLSVAIKRFESHAQLPHHAHDNAYCCLLLEGFAEERLGGDRIDLEPSSFSVRFPGMSHTVAFRSDRAEALIIELDVGRFEQFREDGFFPEPGVWSAPPSACVAAGRIRDESPSRDPASTLMVEGLALELLGLALRDVQQHRGSTPPAWLRRARERLREEPENIASITNLAEQSGVHPSHFAAVFRTWYRESPGQFLRRIRLESATVLLQTTDLPLAEIADRAGYCDQSHFTNDYKRRCGITPGSYRRILRRGRAGT